MMTHCHESVSICKRAATKTNDRPSWTCIAAHPCKARRCILQAAIGMCGGLWRHAGFAPSRTTSSSTCQQPLPLQYMVYSSMHHSRLHAMTPVRQKDKPEIYTHTEAGADALPGSMPQPAPKRKYTRKARLNSTDASSNGSDTHAADVGVAQGMPGLDAHATNRPPPAELDSSSIKPARATKQKRVRPALQKDSTTVSAVTGHSMGVDTGERQAGSDSEGACSSTQALASKRPAAGKNIVIRKRQQHDAIDSEAVCVSTEAALASGQMRVKQLGTKADAAAAEAGGMGRKRLKQQVVSSTHGAPTRTNSAPVGAEAAEGPRMLQVPPSPTGPDAAAHNHRQHQPAHILPRQLQQSMQQRQTSTRQPQQHPQLGDIMQPSHNNQPGTVQQSQLQQYPEGTRHTSGAQQRLRQQHRRLAQGTMQHEGQMRPPVQNKSQQVTDTQQHGHLQQQQQQQQQQHRKPPRTTLTATSRRQLTLQIMNLIKAAMTPHDLRNILTREANVSALNPVHLSALVSRLPKVCRDTRQGSAESAVVDELLLRLLPRMRELLPETGSRQLGNILWGLCKVGPSAPSARAVAEHLVSHMVQNPDSLATSTMQSLSNILYSLALLEVQEPQLVARLAQLVAASSEEPNPQDISNIMWALATLDILDAPVMSRLCGSATRMLAMDAAAVSLNASAHSATHGRHNSQNVRSQAGSSRPNLRGAQNGRNEGASFTAAAAASEGVATFTPQGLCNMLWALAKLQWQNEELNLAIIARAKQQLHLFNAQNVANICWAATKLGCQDDVLLTAAAERALQLLPGCIPQGLANLLWAYATSGVPAPSLFERVAKVVQQRLARKEAFEPQSLVIILWSFSKLECFSTALFDACIPMVTKQCATLSQQEATMALWAYSRYCANSEASLYAAADLAVVQLLVGHLMSSFHKLNQHEVASLASSMALLTYHDLEVQRLVMEGVKRLGQEMQPQQMANAAWFMGKFCIKDPEVTAMFMSSLAAGSEHWALQHMAFLAWSMAITAPEDTASMKLVLDRMSQQYSRQQQQQQQQQPLHRDLLAAPQALAHMPVNSMSQVVQAVLAFVDIGHAPQELARQVTSSPLYQAALAVWLGHTSTSHSSTSQHQVLEAVKGMPGVEEAVMEWRTPDGLFSVDIMVLYKGHYIAIEVDGPFHFAVNCPDYELGETLLRRRLLEARGLLVLSVATSAIIMRYTTLPARRSFLQPLLDGLVESSRAVLLEA